MGDVHQFSVSWNEYIRNVCDGLWSLQQHGEFVDMTLAADGHHVKVHKMVLSLASPYIKELISSADCGHPVIFLNEVSSTTLSLILEYIYTGEVVVPKECFKNFMQAGQALHIKGLHVKGIQVKNTCDVSELYQNESGMDNDIIDNSRYSENASEENTHDYIITSDAQEDHYDRADSFDNVKMERNVSRSKRNNVSGISCMETSSPPIQYSLSNQGNLQLVLNRYLYNMKYIARRTNQRKWYCMNGNFKRLKCPAYVVTLNNKILKREGVHNHPYHDQKIMKKIQSGLIYSGIDDAEQQIIERKKKKELSSSGLEVKEMIM